MADAPHIIASIEKNNRERVRVALDEFHGVRLVDIRITVPISGSCDAQTPTKQGVALRVEQLRDLIQALIAADFKAKELGWIGAVHE